MLSRFPLFSISIIIILSVFSLNVTFNFSSDLKAIHHFLEFRGNGGVGGGEIGTRSNTTQLKTIEKTLNELIRRSSLNDYRDPQHLCPGRMHRDYTVVGPPGKWTKCYHFDVKNGKKTQEGAQKFCESIKGSDNFDVVNCFCSIMCFILTQDC